MELLRQKVDYSEANPQGWMEPFIVRLAGDLLHQPAIPLIVGKLHEDVETLSEEIPYALVKIGGDDVIRAIQQDYLTAEWHFRLYAGGILGKVHTDLAVQVMIELLPQEPDLELQDFLAQDLVDHFSTEGNEVARKILLDNPDLDSLRNDLVAACTLMGQDFPELEQWRKEAETEKRRKPFLYGTGDYSPPSESRPSESFPSAPDRQRCPSNGMGREWAATILVFVGAARSSNSAA
jgi:hypothetical protein